MRNYIDTLVGLPWKKKSKVSTDMKNSEKILDADHYGLEKIKERIVEYLAVQQRVDKLKAPILASWARPAWARPRSGSRSRAPPTASSSACRLGGVRDEAEIRGHRRTYIGSMPGKILQNMTKVGVRNPLFLLDEVDKMGMDFRGDPSSALLEVLDPEQNHLRRPLRRGRVRPLDVMFVATANTLKIPAPLLDRMELIRLSGYTEDEKVHIGKQYLLPKQYKANGIKDGELTVTERRSATSRATTRGRPACAGWTARSPRSRARWSSPSCTKKKDGAHVTVTSKNLDKYLGVRKFSYGMAEKENQVGQVTGLAWTEVGGELLTIEAVKLPGKGKTIDHRPAGRRDAGIHQGRDLRGARACPRGSAWPRTSGRRWTRTSTSPEGATPKDGPSAGIAIATAITSVAHRDPGALRRGDDRRDHAARRGAADRPASRRSSSRPTAAASRSSSSPRRT